MHRFFSRGLLLILCLSALVFVSVQPEMSLKLHPETSCFHVFCSAKFSPLNSVGPSISVSPVEKAESIHRKKQFRILESPNFGDPKPSVERAGIVVHERRSNKLSLARNPDSRRRRNTTPNVRTAKRNGKCDRMGNRVSADKVHTKCSTKWASYGGCIPAVLEALEAVEDLDEALRPWAGRLSNKERSIILKEQSSWERALEIFEWLKRKGCYELNVIHYNIMLRILGKACKWRHVLFLWAEMNYVGVVPVNSTYGTLIDVYSKGGLKKEALCWLGMMNKKGMEPDEVTMGIVVQLYKKAGEFKKAEEFFKRWSSTGSLKHDENANVHMRNGDRRGHVSLSSYTYNTLIDTYGKSGQVKEASDTFSQMLSEGIVPTTVTFNSMIHMYGNHGRLQKVASLIDKMEQLHCKPDTRTYNILVSLHAKHDDINMVTSYFRKMKEACLEPDIVSYRTLLYAYSIRHMITEAEKLVEEIDERGLQIDEYTQSALTRMYIEIGLLEKSLSWFCRFDNQGHMSSEGYSANIDAFGERGYILEAEYVFRCCKERKKVTVLVFNVMIKAYGMAKCYDKACQLFDSRETLGVVPDNCSYNSLIQILASADLPHPAWRYLKEMQQAGLAHDCVPCCAVISSFVKLGQLDMAEALYKEMIQWNIEPDVLFYGVLINACADLGNVHEATRYVTAMKSAGLPGNVVIYNSLIKLYTKVGYLEEAQETYKCLKLLHSHPDVYSSNCMIDLYSERSMVSQAEEVFENLKRTGDANEFTYAMMLCMYKRNGRFEEACHIAKQMKELGLVKDLLSYNNILGLYAMDGRFWEAVVVFKEMIGKAILPDDCTFKSLASILMKCGVPRKAINKLQVARRKDVKSGVEAWMLTLTSVVFPDNDDGFS